MSQPLQNLFPDEGAIPEQFRISRPIEQREYLIDGELRSWKGNLNPVLSPVFIS
jgi:glyceraldehyde-3-phosphate dehydrogenase (NADP+)